MKLIKTSAAAWAREMEWEAAHRGLDLTFGIICGALVAQFTSGEFYCYDRTWSPT